MKRNCQQALKSRNATLPTNLCVAPNLFSQGDGNQSHLGHKKKGVLIPHCQKGLAVRWEKNKVEQKLDK